MDERTPFLKVLPAFCTELRREAGLRVSTAHVLSLQRAVSAMPHLDLEDLYWCGRAVLSVTPRTRPAYDAVFHAFFLGSESAIEHRSDPGTVGEEGAGRQGASSADRPTPVMGDEERPDDGPTERLGSDASTTEVLRVTPFAACSADQQTAVLAMVRRLRLEWPTKPARRTTPAARPGRLDMRRTTQHAFRHSGAVWPLWKHPGRRPRRVVLLIDVSRSMGPYSRLLFHFGHAVLGNRSGVEVVCFGTRVTRVTRLLRRHRTQQALEAAAATVLDWDGGTRIGESLRSALSMGSVRGSLRDSVVVMMSDGLEQDDPEALAEALQRVRRTCHSVVWANPLAGDPRYEPLTAGMVAALPFLDALVPCDTVASLEAVLRSVSALTAAPSRPGRVSGRARPTLSHHGI